MCDHNWSIASRNVKAQLARARSKYTSRNPSKIAIFSYEPPLARRYLFIPRG